MTTASPDPDRGSVWVAAVGTHYLGEGWTDLGYIDETGLVPDPDPPPARAPGGTADFVDRLDAAVDGRCGCGCGTPITDSSPSAYYATAHCQSAWMNQHATNPGEVYSRPDAASVLVGSDDTPIPLREPARSPTGGGSGGASGGWAPPGDRLQVYGPGTLPDFLSYHRWCDGCRTATVPVIVEDDTHDITVVGVWEPVRSYPTGHRQWCSACEATSAGPVYLPTVETDRGPVPGWLFTLSGSYGRVSSALSRLALDRAANRRLLVDSTWRSMERDLGRFEREWSGRAGRRAAADRCTDPRL
jgi:hypothetical protein